MAHAEKPSFRESFRNKVENGAIIAGVLGLIGILSLSSVAIGALISVPIFEKWSRRTPGGGAKH